MKVKCLESDRCLRSDCKHHEEHEPIEGCNSGDVYCDISRKYTHCEEIIKIREVDRLLELQPA
jgi:hypothetical protein